METIVTIGTTWSNLDCRLPTHHRFRFTLEHSFALNPKSPQTLIVPCPNLRLGDLTNPKKNDEIKCTGFHLRSGRSAAVAPVVASWRCRGLSKVPKGLLKGIYRVP